MFQAYCRQCQMVYGYQTRLGQVDRCNDRERVFRKDWNQELFEANAQKYGPLDQ
jgi:hypothetical protein